MNVPPNLRQPDESFEKYRKRLKAGKVKPSVQRIGRTLWASSIRGTYVRRIHGPLTK